MLYRTDASKRNICSHIARQLFYLPIYMMIYIYIRYTTKDGSVDKKNYFSFFFLCLRIRQLVNSVWEIISPFFHFWKFQRSESKINFTIRIKTGNLYIYIYFFFDSTILNVSLNFSTVSFYYPSSRIFPSSNFSHQRNVLRSSSSTFHYMYIKRIIVDYKMFYVFFFCAWKC